MNIFVSTITILVLVCGIGYVLDGIGKKEDELGKQILEKALSRSMLLTLGIMVLSIMIQVAGVLLKVEYLKTAMNVWTLFIVVLLIVLINLKKESRKYK